MKIRKRFFIRFLGVLLFLLCSGLIATADNHDLVDIQIPPMKDVVGSAAKPEYLNPTKDFTNQMIQWANSCRDHAIELRNRGEKLIDKRDAARTAAFGADDTWQGDLIDFVGNIVSKNMIDPLKNFAKTLLGMSDKIDREQAYAEACKEVNEHYYPTTHDAKIMMESMYAVAVAVKANFEKKHSGSELDALVPLPIPPIEIPPKEEPRWRCKANGIGSGLSESLLTCLDTFDTPYKARDTHRIICGGENDPDQSVSGCGKFWYTCKTGDGDKHAVKSCDHYIVYWRGGLSWPKRLGRCGASYRNCPGSQSAKGVHHYEAVYSYNNGKEYASSYQVRVVAYVSKQPHGGNLSSTSASFYGATKYSQTIDEMIDETLSCSSCIDGSKHCPNASGHSGGGSASVSPDMSPSGGSYSVSAGNTHTANVTFPSGYTMIYWYLKSPSESGYGTNVATTSGDGSATTATYTYSIPSGVSGDYVLTAYTHLSDSSIVEPSYTLTVNSPINSSMTYACGVHSGHPGNASGHALVSCGITNMWGHTCIATGVYMCQSDQSHTCVFPTFTCARNGCSQTVNDPKEHYITCMHGHRYWSCDSLALDLHRTRTCSRRKVVRQVWNSQLGIYEAEWGTCGESWAMCRQRSCRDIYGAVRDHE